MPDLKDGETAEIKGSAAKPYIIKNVGGVYSCSCPAWRNQSIAIEKRTCKHIRKYRGDAAETARIGSDAPERTVQREKADTSKDGPPLLLAQTWDNATDLADWWMSEKLDGVRAYWDGQRFISRQGNEYHAPDWFLEGLPTTPLDGELWIDRKKFQRTVSIVRRQDKSEHWREVRFLVFDAPACDGGFESRLEYLNDSLHPRKQPFAMVHNHQRCTGLTHLKQELARIESLSGEGLMLREPNSRYEIGRSSTLVKVKTFHDAEAIVLDHQAGKGRHKGRLGALIARLADGTEFSIGTGFSDAQRSSPPPIGSVVTFRYQELSDGGVPRFPSFVRVHESTGSAKALEPDKALTAKKPAKKRSTAKGKAESTQANSASVRSSSSDQTASTRYFEFVEGTSSKFWEVSLDGSNLTVRYGRIGSAGTTKSTACKDASTATAQMSKLISEKTSKGYREK